MRFLHFASLVLLLSMLICFFIVGCLITSFLIFVDLTGGLNLIKRPQFMQSTMVNTIEMIKLVQFIIVNAFVARFAHLNQIKIHEIKGQYDADKRKHRGYIDNWRVYLIKNIHLPL